MKKLSHDELRVIAADMHRAIEDVEQGAECEECGEYVYGHTLDHLRRRCKDLIDHISATEGIKL